MIQLNRNNLVVALAVLGAAGCGFGGGGGGGGGSTIAPIGSAPVGSGATWMPTQVTRSTGYAFTTVYTPNQAAGGSITAIAVAPTSTDVWVGISPLGRVDHVDQNGPVAEASFVFDVLGFAVVGSNVYAGTSNPVAARAGACYSRDTASAQWMLSLDGTLKECVPLAFLNEVYAFQGESDGRAAAVSHLDSTSNQWREVAALGSMVPACALSFQGEALVGGRTNNSRGGPAKLFHGTGISFTEQSVPVATFIGQTASVAALAEAFGVLFVSVEVRDANSGSTIGGQVFYLDPVKGLVSINQTQSDAVIAFAASDGTIYGGTRAGKLLWLDESGKWNPETNLPSNLGVTALVFNGRDLMLGVRSQQGAQLIVRKATGAVTPPPPSSSGLVFTSISPATGPVAGGTAVTIMGNKFADVTVVRVGGVPLTNLRVVSDVQITGTTPAGTTGAQDVVITSMSKGTVTARGAFTYGAAAPVGLSYATDARPIFTAKCIVCHGPGGVMASRPLTSFNEVVNGMTAASQKYVIAGNPNGSHIINKIDSTVGGSNATMAVHVTVAERAKIRQWIQDGAKP
ncbi:MAG: IPT/TIG domain-containing protein [Planctomycetota bacterium]